MRYADVAGCAPSVVEVLVSGVGRYGLSGPATGVEVGVTYATAVTFPRGSWPYRFEATSGSGPGQRTVTLAAVSPARVVISVPTPKPTEKPTPRPTVAPAPTPRPTRTPRPTADATGPASTAAPASTTAASPTLVAASPSAAAPTATVSGHVAIGGLDPGGRSGGPTPPASRAGGRPADAPIAPSSRAFLALGIDPALAIPVGAWSLTTALGVILFAYVVRRPIRDGESGGSALGAVIAGGPVVPGAGRDTEHHGRGDGLDGLGLDPEAGMPRWLRPSIRAQRQSGGRGPGPVALEPVRFAGPPPAGVERRTIGYRLVRVSDGPDDIRTREVGRLDRGDEVEVIGESDGFLQVRTPSGLEGWVPRVVIVG